MNPHGQRARQLLAELDDARELERQVNAGWRLLIFQMPLSLALSIPIFVIACQQSAGMTLTVTLSTTFLLWIYAGMCVPRFFWTSPREANWEGSSYTHAVRPPAARVRRAAAERAFNDYVIEHP